MFSYAKEGPANRQVFLPPPIAGLNTRDPLAGMREGYATILENWVPYPDRLDMRLGANNHVTGFADTVQSLHVWEGPSSSQLLAVTNAGVYNASAAGAVGALVQARTNGKCLSTLIATGANVYLFLVNGTDSVARYDGTTWITVAAYGGFTTSTACAVETYKQRVYFAQKDTLTLWYLGVNSVAGAATSYDLGAIFRRGGSIQAIATWTIDGGTGPDDHLIVATSGGEVAVFSGTDPTSASLWSLRGVYYLGTPLGRNCLFKFGGDVLFLTEQGVFPVSKAVQTAAIDRSVAITNTVQAYFSTAVSLYASEYGWQTIFQPSEPLLLINLPGYPDGRQLIMNTQSKAWGTFSGWTALCWARFNGDLYFGTGTKVAQALVGNDDFDANITATLLQAYTRLNYPKQKRIAHVRPYFTATGNFQYELGVANDFTGLVNSNLIAGGAAASSLWGSAIWGTSRWAGSIQKTDWRGVPDIAGIHKALYLQVSSNLSRVALQGWDLLYLPGSTF